MLPATRIAHNRITPTVLHTPDGRPQSLPVSGAVGRRTLVIVYRGDWCPYCSVQLADYGFMNAEFAALGTQVLGVSSETPEQLANFRSRLFLPFDLLLDNEGAWSRSLGIWSEAEGCPFPATILNDEVGKILFSHVGMDPSDRPLAHDILALLKGSS